jgi:hypothetical protein
LHHFVVQLLSLVLVVLLFKRLQRVTWIGWGVAASRLILLWFLFNVPMIVLSIQTFPYGHPPSSTTYSIESFVWAWFNCATGPTCSYQPPLLLTCPAFGQVSSPQCSPSNWWYITHTASVWVFLSSTPCFRILTVFFPSAPIVVSSTI